MADDIGSPWKWLPLSQEIVRPMPVKLRRNVTRFERVGAILVSHNRLRDKR